MQYEVEKTIAEISANNSTAKRLTLTSWNGNPAKLDLRIWRIDKKGDSQPGKGVTLTEDEAAAVAAAISDYLGGAQHE